MSRRVSVFSWLYGRSCYKRPYSLLWRLPLHTFIQRTILLFSQTMTPYRTYHYHSSFIKYVYIHMLEQYISVFTITCTFMLINRPNRATMSNLLRSIENLVPTSRRRIHPTLLYDCCMSQIYFNRWFRMWDFLPVRIIHRYFRIYSPSFRSNPPYVNVSSALYCSLLW